MEGGGRSGDEQRWRAAVAVGRRQRKEGEQTAEECTSRLEGEGRKAEDWSEE